MRFANRVALVTGGASGVGRACALRLHREGAAVAVLDTDEPEALAVSREIVEDGGRSVAVRCDVSRPDDVERAVEECLRSLGGLHIVVTATDARHVAPIEETTLEAWERVLATNVTGTFLTIRYAVHQMKRQRYGRIVVVASIAGSFGLGGRAAYSASQGCVLALTRDLVTELSPFGITANAVCFGPVETSSPGPDIAGSRSGETVAVPLRRRASPEEIAAVVTFLASDEASFVTGQTLAAEGGATSVIQVLPGERTRLYLSNFAVKEEAQ